MIGGWDFYMYLMAWAILGCLISTALAFIPGLHVLNVIGFAMIGYIFYWYTWMEELAFTMLMIGMLTGYSLFFTVTTTLFGTADDSTMFIVMPSQKYLAQGRGHEAIVLTGMGHLIGLVFLLVVLTTMQNQLRVIRNLCAPHYPWIVGIVILYILMSEFPKDFTRSRSRLGKLIGGWKTLVAGYFTFILASIIGILMFNQQLIPMRMALQNFAPVLIGLFAVPGLLLNIISDMEVPRQFIPRSVDITTGEALRGGIPASIGGLFAALVPTVTAGPGGYLAGHATGQHGDKPFIMSYFATRIVYYVGAVMLFFLPMVHLRRGLTSIWISTFYVPETAEEYYLLAAAIAITGALSFIILLGLSRVVLKMLSKIKYQNFQVAVLVFTLVVVFIIGSWQGLLVCSVATAIGIVPVMFHSRRTNLLACLLVPMFLNMTGLMPLFAGWLGLV